MSGLVYVGDALYPMDRVERAPAFWEVGRKKAEVAVRVDGKTVMLSTFNGELNSLLMRPTQLVPALPGTYVLRAWLADDASEAEVWKATVVAWALCFDGETRPVTPHGVNDGNEIAAAVHVELPDGTVSSTSPHDDTPFYDSVESYRQGEGARKLAEREGRAARAARADRDTGI